MSNILVISFIGLAGGLAIGLQAPLASLINQHLGIMESVFIIHLGGAIGALALLTVYRGGSLGEWQSVPWYALAAGLLGIVLISTQVLIIPSIGVATTITLIIAGQLVMATVIDHYGLFEIEARTLGWDKIIGLVIVLFGVWLTVRK